MQRTRQLATLGGMALLTTACATQAPRPQNLIDTALVINSVKCGFASALAREQGLPADRRRLSGNVATVQLQLKVADTRTFGAGATARGTGVVPWQGGLSFSDSQAWTVDTTINASYKLNATNAAVCKAANVPLVQGEYYDPLGFSRWLSDTLGTLANVSLEKPSGQLDKLTYDATFGVTKDFGANAGLQIAFLDANVSGKINRIDTQHLTIVISGAPAAPAKPAKPQKPDGSGGTSPPAGGMGPLGGQLRNFSTIQPSVQ